MINEVPQPICVFAAGELMTTARWMRTFVQSHPDYKKDSVVSEKICYDLMDLCDRIAKNELAAPELFGTPSSKTSDELPKKCLKIQEEMARMEAVERSKLKAT